MPMKKAARKPAAKKAAPRRKAAPKRRAPARKAPSTGPSLVLGRAGQVSYTHSRHTHRASPQVRAMKLVAAPSLYSDSYGIRSPGVSGQQTSTSIANLNRNVLLAVQQRASTAAGNGSGTTVNAGLSRSVILGVVEEYLFTNSTNAPVELDLYDIVLKRDLPVNNIISTANYGYSVTAAPENYWDIGLLIQGGLDPSTVLPPRPASMLSSVPTDSQLFNQFFTITRKHRVMLSAGASHKHQVDTSTKRIVDDALLGTPAGVKGFTTYTMWCTRGMPVVMEETGLITSSSFNINVIRSLRIRYSWVNDVSYSSYFTTSLQTAVAGENFMSQILGVPEAIVTVP